MNKEKTIKYEISNFQINWNNDRPPNNMEGPDVKNANHATRSENNECETKNACMHHNHNYIHYMYNLPLARNDEHECDQIVNNNNSKQTIGQVLKCNNKKVHNTTKLAADEAICTLDDNDDSNLAMKESIACERSVKNAAYGDNSALKDWEKSVKNAIYGENSAIKHCERSIQNAVYGENSATSSYLAINISNIHSVYEELEFDTYNVYNEVNDVSTR